MDNQLTKLRVEYLTKRLDHTLTHTQTSSRLIYFIDGAVLAFLYFMINKLGTTDKTAILILAFPVLVLSLLNYLHSRLIEVQRIWYKNIDEKLIQILGRKQVKPAESDKSIFSSTHGIYKLMHNIIATFLLLMALFMFCYGLSCTW